MLKHLMNGGSLLSYAVYDAESDAKAARDATRAELLKNNTVVVVEPKEGEEVEAKEEEEEKEEEKEEESEEEKEDEKDPNEGLTPEQIKEKEDIAKAAAKAQRKDDRMQRRIDEATAAKKKAEDELKAFKEANPDTKLSEEEVETLAEAKANKKLRDKELKDLQDQFTATCDKMQKAAIKIDAKFNDKVDDIVDQFGPIPSFMIGTLDEMENGPKVLAHIMSDDDLAESLWKMSNAKMAKSLVELSLEIADKDKKAKKKQISKVEVITPVNGNNVQSTIITSEDTKPENMDRYIAKRKAQIEERRKAGLR